MLTIRRSRDRGHFDHGWLDTRHTFSFADYYDPGQMGFRSLRVINDDVIAGGEGFPPHPHRDMEIVTYVIEGSLAHKDSMGNGSIIRPGEVQRMSAGTGVTHSEYNNEPSAKTRLLQIWLLPERAGLTPSYEQKLFGDARNNRLCLVAAPDGADGAVTIHQDARIYAAVLDDRVTIEHRLRPGRYAWVQIARGGVSLNGERLAEGDGAALGDIAELRLEALRGASELLVFDLG